MRATIIIDDETYTYFPTFVRNDYGYIITFNVREDDDTAYNLTGHTAIFKTKLVSSSFVSVSSPCTVSSAGAGIVVYTIASGDLMTSGVYNAELQVNYGTTSVQTVSLGKLFVQDDL